MKNLILSFFLLFLPFYLLSQEYFYYYKGEKQFLELDTGYIFVSTVNGPILQRSNLVSKEILTLNKEQTSPLLKQKQNIEADFYWTKIELSGSDLKGAYIEWVDRIKQIEGVQVVSPYFKGKSGKKIGLSNFFYVKLKSLSDITLLNKYSVDNKVIIVKQDKFMPLWFALSCTKETEKNAMEMANKFYESQMFQYAEPDLMVDDLLSCTDDTYFSNQWGLRNTGQYGGTAGIDVKACDAWGISTGTGVTVAVIDHGIELNHPDLQANIHPLSFDTETGASPSIVRGNHGVACAGIIGAVGNNSAGVRGVAPNARLMSISNSLLGNTLSRMSRGEGINWAVENGADVISNSWGSSVQFQIIDDAITNAVINGRNGLGCIVVFASGNDNGAVNYPANSNPAILAVGAISPCGQRKSPNSCDGETDWGSNFGSQLDVVAPGVLVPTTDRQGNLGYNPNDPIHTRSGGNKITSDYTNRDYTVWFNGTSAACPHVAGIAALMLSVNPTLTGQEVRDVIEQTAQKIGGYSYTTTSGRPNGTWHQEMGYGLVNAYAAVNAVVPRITGPSTVCDQATYTIEGFDVDDLPDGVTVNWSCGPYLSISSEQGMVSCQFTVTGNGSSWVSVEINNNGVPVSLPYYNTWTGNPRVYGIEGPVGIPQYATEHYRIDNSKGPSFSEQGITTYYWSVTDNLRFERSYINQIDTYIKGLTPGRGTIRFHTVNTCGTSTFNLPVLITSTVFAVYPNPAEDIVTVELQEEEPADEDFFVQRATQTFSAGPYEIQLWSASAMLRRYTTDQPVYQIPVSGLPAGIYFVRVIKDGQTYTKKLIKR